MNKKKVSWRETLKLNRRAMGIWFKAYPKMFLAMALHLSFEALTPYFTVFFSAQIIAELSGERDSQRLINLIIITLVGSAALQLLTAGLKRISDAQTESGRIWYRRNRFFDKKTLYMDFSVMDDPNTYDLRTQIGQNDLYDGWGMGKIIIIFEGFVRSITRIGGGVALTLSLFIAQVPSGEFEFLNSPLSMLVLILFIIGISIISPHFSTKGKLLYSENVDTSNAANRMFSYFLRHFANGKEDATDVRMYRQDLIIDDAVKNNVEFGKKGTLYRFLRGKMGIFSAISLAIATLSIGAIYVYVALKSWAGAFGVGEVTQYVGALTAMAMGITALLDALGQLKANTPFLRPALAYLDLENPTKKGSKKIDFKLAKNHSLEFKNVSFHYPNSKKIVLKDISFTIKAGKRLAIVGENGSGKTTLIKLLCRLYEPTDGQILLDGVNINEYSYEEYIELLSVVFQDFKLLAYTLGENVGAGEKYDREKAKKALIDAGFKDRLESFEKGLDTYLYKDFDKSGVEVSGGEAQKIAIARALYRNAPFIILDEPTAALDPVAESEIYENLNKIVGEKTAVFISHRLSSCRFCDEIVVFKDGSLSQNGTHEELIKIDGEYASLWYAQADYYVSKSVG